MGEATLASDLKRLDDFISIHASRGGSDGAERLDTIQQTDFNPRFPWGKRQAIVGRRNAPEKFQSTLPVGEATLLAICPKSVLKKFQSTLPVGEATVATGFTVLVGMISIHASRGGSDLRSCRQRASQR